VPEVVITLKASKSGILQALALCIIHGLWEGEQALKVEVAEAVKTVEGNRIRFNHNSQRMAAGKPQT
jgi:hypothetical protein